MPQKKNKADLEDKVYYLKDVNKDLKGKQVQLEQNLKKAQWEASYFRKKAKSVENKMRKNNISNIESSELNKMVGTLKNKNEFYRKENLKLRENVRNTMSKPPKQRYKRPKSARMKRNKKHKAPQQQLNTILTEIRQSIQENHKEHQENDVDHITLSEVRKQLQEKHQQISFLTTKYEELQSNLKADRIIQKRALDQCKQYKIMVQQTEKTNHELQQKICDLEGTQHEIESLKLYIKNIKGENTLLQERIGKLTANSLLGDQLETNRISQITSSHHTKISKIQSKLNESQNKLESKENVINDLKCELKKIIKENDALKNIQNESKKDFEIIQKQNEEMKVKTKLFEDESGINFSDLECALQLIEKSKRSKDNADLDFLNPIEIDKCDDPIILRAKIDELLIKNRDLILECTQNQNLMETQINFNKKMDKDYHDLEDEYIALKSDHNNIKSEMDRLNKTRNKSNLLISENELFVASDMNDISFTTTDNLITFKVLYIELNPNCSYFESNINPLTMIIVDFFEFESVFSNIYGGFHPKYNLFCQYKIKMDNFFLQYIENDYISIDFVYKINNKFKMISNNKISLKNLLITPDSCIQNEVELISNNDDEEYIGKLSFIAKMLRSIDKTETQKVIHHSDDTSSSTSIIHSQNHNDDNINDEEDQDVIDELEQELNKIETQH